MVSSQPGKVIVFDPSVTLSNFSASSGDRLMFNENQLVLAKLQQPVPVLQHWNSDGTQAVTNAVEGTDYYDMAYDKNDDVYYAIKLNTTLSGAAVDPNDDFNDVSTGFSFDAVRWTESSSNVYFLHNTSSGTLDYKSNGGAGQLYGNYGFSGDFTYSIDLDAIVKLNENDYFSLEGKEYSTGNQRLLSAISGPYLPNESDTSGSWKSAVVEYSDTFGGTVDLQDFRINPMGMDFSFPGGKVVYEITYDSGAGEYLVTASGITHENASSGVPYSIDSASFTVQNVTTPFDGQKFTITANVSETSISNSTTTSGIRLQLERANTNAYSRYKEAQDGSFTTHTVSNIPDDINIRPQIYALANNEVDVGADNFTASGPVFFDSPVFSVVTVNKDGNLEQVAGVSDSDGYVIKRWDLIQDATKDYDDFTDPKVYIATNGLGSGSGGEIYLKVNDALYKYTKAALPIDIDDGSSASTSTTGEIPATGITDFAYNGYTQAGLSYIVYDSDLGGTFVRTIDDTTLTQVEKKVFIDASSANFPFAWNVSDLSTLYIVDATSLKLYDLNETKAGFVNVTSDKQVLAAGTGETATITAQVVNVYGEPKAAKSMTFTVSAGDGALTPATGCSDINGEDTTTYTVGSAVGTATITVSVSDTSC